MGNLSFLLVLRTFFFVFRYLAIQVSLINFFVENLQNFCCYGRKYIFSLHSAIEKLLLYTRCK